ncbi:DUF4954 family protein [uncultured Treponema sp.]|uniref:DUF4954 family protein n=1 Tax=uncultured Treponema sp. TaxID=162155 RepID=UPI0025FD7E38|nr:DUF4954 family protein [uncultured Treponema sp.]
MVSVSKVKNSTRLPQFYSAFLEGKRQLTKSEIEVLSTHNKNSDSSWKNVWVDENEFDCSLVSGCEIFGFLVIGRLSACTLKYHDLALEAGLYDSYFENVVIGDECVVRNVHYLSNYKIGNRNILFNIDEMSTTNHSKFGNGTLKEGEPESNRIWIGVGNENDGRAVLAFENMIPADAYIWAKYRDDIDLQQHFVSMTEKQVPKTLNTYGITGDDVVIKNTTLLKDAKIGNCTYIKGAFKLKNITVLSSEEEPSQIGEGVELVNGILGFGSRVFYQAVAVRFVIGRNCQLKYGARLLNSILGDNSTVSCCEILNNLIFPFHEQHHNSSFLIASMVGGQSNIASGATIGSNHNSRAADGEMFAGRGFWPGLCSDFKHNSKFASFTLIAKGTYQYELNITFPFSLVASNGSHQPITIIPAYWFMYNMYAVARNKSKFEKRDKRKVKVQHIETDPIAPDTIQEVEAALRKLIELTGEYLLDSKNKKAIAAKTPDELYNVAKNFLHENQDAVFTLPYKEPQKKYGAVIIKPVKAYKAYRRIVKFFAVRTLCEYCVRNGSESLTKDDLVKISQMPLYSSWVNVGGQIIPEKCLFELFEKIKHGTIDSWDKVHEFYDSCQNQYEDYKVAYALSLLENLYSRSFIDFTKQIYSEIIEDALFANQSMFDAVLISRMKDFEDPYRMQNYDNAREMNAVLGGIADNEFILEMQEFTKDLKEKIGKVFEKLNPID